MNTAVIRAVWDLASSIYAPNDVYVYVPAKNPTTKAWDEGRAYAYPSEWKAIEARISGLSAYDTYWCPQVFKTAGGGRTKANIHDQQAVLWADLDDVDPRMLAHYKPSIAWKSSTSRYQSLWLLDAPQGSTDIEATNRALTYSIGADKGGWDLTQVLRIPGSMNYKYAPPQKGELMWAERRMFNLERLSKDLNKTEDVEEQPKEANLGATYNIPEEIQEWLEMTSTGDEDRSERLWWLSTSLLEAGLSVIDVVNALSPTVWNKFEGRRNAREALLQDILKAEKRVRQKSSSVTPPFRGGVTEDKVSWAIPFDEFASMRMEKPEWLVEGIWQQGTYGMIAGEPKTYKSIQATDLALSVASGRPYLGYFNVIKQGTVLYVQEENNAQTVQDRIYKIAHSKGLLTSTSSGLQLPSNLPLFFSNNCGINLTQRESRELLEKTIEDIKPILLILDPLYMMMGTVDENSAQEVGDLLRWLTHLRNKYGLAIVVCHHYNKAGTNSSSRGGQRVRGSSAFHAWVESAMYIKATAELYTVKIEREFRAFPTMPELTLKLKLGSPGELLYVPTLTTAEDDISNPVTSLKIEEILTLLASSPRTEDELVHHTRMSRSQLRRLLATLYDTGHIDKLNTSGGRSIKLRYVLR